MHTYMHTCMCIYVYTYICVTIIISTSTICVVIISMIPLRLHAEEEEALGQDRAAVVPFLYNNCLHCSICACHPCTGAMLILSLSFKL